MKLSNKFIKATDEMCELEQSVPAPYFRKKFCLDFVPEKAEITITGLGFYELYINGENITKGPLAPYISNTDDIVYYDNYDISGKLNKGENVIGILLGNGMRNPYGGFVWGLDKSKSRGPVCTALCLEAEKGDEKFELEADTSFKVHTSPILFNDLRMEYRYDARLEIPNWNEVDFDDSDWEFALNERTPKGKALLCNADPIIEYKELSAVDVKHFEETPFAFESCQNGAKPYANAICKNAYLYDFGENNAGVTKLKINGKPGQMVSIRHIEYLQEGKFPSLNTVSFTRPGEFEKYIEYGQKDVFICKGGEECFVPKFKYDGFRYALVEGLEQHQATEDTLTYIVMSSDIKKRADFKCSDEILNKLQEMTQRSDISNFYYFPTDCPHREKNGWTGDISFSAEQILVNFDASKSFAVWIENVRAAQNEEGVIPAIIPTGGWGYYHPPKQMSSGPAWDAAAVNVPYYIYKYEGDKKIISDNLQMIMRLMMYQRSAADGDGLQDYGHWDWNHPFRLENGSLISPLKLTSTLAALETAERAAFMFNIIDKKNEAEYAKGFAEELRTVVRTHLIDFNTMTVIGDCQTSQAMAIECGIFNENEVGKAGKRLVEIIERDGFVTVCGVIGLRYIFHALVKINEWDLAYKLITSTERTCYGAWVEKGTTTLNEHFPYDDGIDEASQNHHYMGDISSLFIQEIAGIKINPNVRDIYEFEISPVFITDLNYAKGYYDTKYGRINTEWERKGEDIILKILVPCGMHGKLLLRGGYCIKNNTTYELNGGEYKFVLSK